MFSITIPTMNIMQLAADLAQRMPEMAQCSAANNAELIARMLERALIEDGMRCGERRAEIVKESVTVPLATFTAAVNKVGETMNIMQLAADLAQRVPEMAKNSTANNVEIIATMIADAHASPTEWQRAEIAQTPQPFLMAEMTLRDWFAGMAMQSMTAQVAFDQNVENMILSRGITIQNFEAFTAMCAYNFADAMLAERKKP